MIKNSDDDGNKTVTTTVQGRTASTDCVRTVLTDDQIAEMIKAYRSGITAKALAERYGVHYSTIKKRLRKYGVRRD